MKLLSVDTSADICSVSLVLGEDDFSFHESRPREHAKILLPTIQRLLDEAGVELRSLDGIVLGRGPGSFTGVRIATGVAQGLAFSSDLGIACVSTLQSLAYSCVGRLPHKTIHSALDARMSEIYTASYRVDEQGLPQPMTNERVIKPEALRLVYDEKDLFCGNGWACEYGFDEALQLSAVTQAAESALLPNALDSAALAKALMNNGQLQFVAPEEAVPTYIRDNVTWANKPKVGS